MDPYLNLNNSGATNLTLGKNDVQEATVVTNAYSGQYGQQAGAQVSYVTKSGTNQFHGNAEYWWTGRAMDANDYFNNLNGTPRPFANNNRVGSFARRTDQEGQAVLLRRTPKEFATSFLLRTTVFSPTAAFANATLANLATTRSGFGAAVFEDVQPVRIGARLQPRSRRTGRRLSGPHRFRWQLLPVSTEQPPLCRERSTSSADALTTTCPTRSPVLAGTHGPRHAGDLCRSDQPGVQRRQPPACL